MEDVDYLRRFSVIPMILVGCFAVAALNVVIRRESAYLVEERIKVAVDQRKEIIDSVKGSDNFTSVVADQGELEIRSFRFDNTTILALSVDAYP